MQQFNLKPINIGSSYSDYELPFYQTRDSLLDITFYKSFLNNAKARFRKSKTYTNYKKFLYELGLNKCMIHGNINADMSESTIIEMHHNMLSLSDITLVLCEHLLNTNGYVTTYQLVNALKEEHINHRVQLVMLSLTAHQLAENTDNFFIDPKSAIGNWYEFINMYKRDFTLDIAYKIYNYLNQVITINNSNEVTNQILTLRDEIMDWSMNNE